MKCTKDKLQKSILFLFLIGLLPLNIYSQIQVNDSIKVKKDKTAEEKTDRNVMLNATSATEPRQVAIGVPTSYTPVNENGLPAVFFFYPNTTGNHWRNDASLSHIGLLKVSEVALTTGDIGYGVNSFTELGGDKFKGKVNYKANHFGSQTFDMNLSGPMAKNWYYTLGTYQNFDPGSFKLGFTSNNDRTQMYRAGLTHTFNDNKSKISVLYKYANVRSLANALGELTYLQQYRHLDAYSGSEMPPKERVPYTLGKAGIFFNHPKISLVSAFTYGNRDNSFGRLTVVDPDGVKDPEIALAGSGEKTLGWTTDILATPFKNFSLHFLFTIQDPKYTGYTFSAFGKEYDYTDKMLTGQSKVLIEIDPSYNITKDLSIWASFRYFSKQYANIGIIAICRYKMYNWFSPKTRRLS